MIVLSQEDESLSFRKKGNSITVANRFIRSLNKKQGYTIPYNKVFARLQDYSHKDSMVAEKLIHNLELYTEDLFIDLMLVRLKWEFKEHLRQDILKIAEKRLKTNLDSSHYYYMIALFFEDSLKAYVARSMGYVRAKPNGEEFVDWRKMNNMIWNTPKVMYTSHHAKPDFTYRNRSRLLDSISFYLKKAHLSNPQEFHFAREMVLLHFKYGKYDLLEKTIPELRELYGKKQRLKFDRFLTMARIHRSKYPDSIF